MSSLRSLARPALFFSLCWLLPAAANAGTIYNEAINGAASNSASSPTSVSLGVGANDILGTIGPSISNSDYFTFSVGLGQTITSIILEAYDAANVSRFDIFNGSVAGAAFGGFISSSFGTFGTVTVGSDLILGGGPLGAGAYTILLQESNAPVVNYTIRLNLSGGSAVPDHSGLAGLEAMLVVGLFAAVGRRLRKSAATK